VSRFRFSACPSDGFRKAKMTHYPHEIACEIEIDKNFNLDRAIYTLSKFLSIEIETAILRLAGSIFSHFTYWCYDDRRSTSPRRRRRHNKLNNRQTSLCSRMNGNSDSSINTTSSSSSSEDELPGPPLNYYQYQRLFGTETRAPKLQYRRIDWQRHVDEKIANGTFSRYYRMNLQSFNKLVSLLENPINHRQSLRSTSGNLPIEDHIYVSAGLRFLAGSMTADIATIYGMSEQSTDRIIDVFLDKVLACEASHKDPLQYLAPVAMKYFKPERMPFQDILIPGLGVECNSSYSDIHHQALSAGL
jgi:hypothetical protein